MELDKTCTLPVGTRDAVHWPIIVGQCDYHNLPKVPMLTPGMFVKFTNDSFTKFIPCPKEEAHGVINPALDEIIYFDSVVILMMPGITTPVRHEFQVDLEKKKLERLFLEQDLEEAKKNDPDCAECYEIRNNAIVRN